jgi:hypothetical protein
MRFDGKRLRAQFTATLVVLMLPNFALADAASDAAAQQAQEAASKAQYDTETAKYQMEEEKIKAQQAQLPTSGISNTATANTSAGLAEANYLAAVAIARVSAKISTDIAKVVPKDGGNIVLFGGETSPDLSEWEAFDVQTSDVERAFNSALIQSKTELKSNEEAPKSRAFVAALAMLPAVLSYLSSTETLSGASLTPDDFILISDVAGTLTKDHALYINGQAFNRSAASDLSARIMKLSQSNQDAAAWVADKDHKTGKAAELYKDAQARFAELMNALHPAAKGSDAPTAATGLAYSLSDLVKEAGIASALKGGHGVFLKVQNMSGSTFTDKNLLTFFGANAFSVSASAVVSYSVVSGDNDRIELAGTMPVMLPYMGLNGVSQVTP